MTDPLPLRMKIVRLKLDMLQPEFADLFELGKNSVYEYENGKRPLPPAVVEKLSLLETALLVDPALGQRVKAAAAAAGEVGFLKAHAAWAVIAEAK